MVRVLRGQVVESKLEHVVHDGGTADPKLLASGGQAVVQVVLVPTGASLAGETHNKVEVLRVKLLEETQHLEAAGLLLVEVGHVVSELEVVSDLASLFLVHLTHHEAGNVG